MAESSFNCSASQGFNFQKDEQVIIGHLVSCKIGDTALKSDIEVTDPENNSSAVKVVGVMTGIFWKGGYADPVQLSCQVSTNNKNTIATMTHKSMSNTAVTFKFNIYDYDPKQKKYYKCFHSNNADLDGLIQKSGGQLAIAIDMDASSEVVSPKNFSFNLGVMPMDKDMQIHLAVSVSDKFAKKWGVAVAA